MIPGLTEEKSIAEKLRDSTPSLVAYCSNCQGIIAATVQTPDQAKENGKIVRDWVKCGLKIATITCAEVRAARWCKWRVKQKEMFALRNRP